MSWATRLPDAERTAAAAAAESVTPAEFARRQAARGAGPTSWPRVAPILESPWPGQFGESCQGYADEDDDHEAAYVVWTDEPTREHDHPVLTCAEHLAGWVDNLTVRLRV